MLEILPFVAAGLAGLVTFTVIARKWKDNCIP